jgi:hypothetical protein
VSRLPTELAFVIETIPLPAGPYGPVAPVGP